MQARFGHKQISNAHSSSARKTGQLLKVHPRNLSSMESQPQMQWTISKRNLRVDILSATTKTIVLKWWLAETIMSPNMKEVVRRRLRTGAYSVKPT